MLKTIKTWLGLGGGEKPAGRVFEKHRPQQAREAWEEARAKRSRFQQAVPNRLTQPRFDHMGTQSINHDLAAHLTTLMGRCAYEVAVNPDFEGIIKTYCAHVVGKKGPTLQVVSKSERFNDAVEKRWKQVFKMPDPGKRVTGAASLRLSTRMLLMAGSFLNVYGIVKRPGPVSFGWRTIHPRRLVTPAEFVSDPRVAFGIRTLESGEPVEYYIDQPQAMSGLGVASVKPKSYPAEVVQHGFAFVEPEQITGFPWLTPSLDVASQLRELDADVAQAYRDQVNHSYGLEAKSPESIVDPDPMPTDYEIERGQANAAPLGWAWKTFQATQPSAQYREFRHELIGKMGRPIHMPLIIALLSAVDSNFASAQFEGTIYADGIAETQGLLEELSVLPCVEEVITEMVLAGEVTRPRGGYELALSWNVPPHANVEKYVKALRTLVEDRIISRSMAISMMGHDPEEVYASCERDNELSAAHGQPEPPVNRGNGAASDTLREVADDLDTEESETADDTKGVAANA